MYPIFILLALNKGCYAYHSNLHSLRQANRLVLESVSKNEDAGFWKSRGNVVSTEVALQDLPKLESEYKKYVEEQQERLIQENIRTVQLKNIQQSNISSSINSNKLITQNVDEVARLPLPFLDIDSIGLNGKWEEKSGNFVLRPSEGITPVGVIHFLGGAFVGAAPHLTYKYLLEALCEGGYIIVATPYRLEMDHVASCDKILKRFDSVAVELAGQYGPVPVIGLGHSCGALLQTLITCLFPDAPRAANILISFNNKPAATAIPAFEELIIPLAKQIMGSNDQSKGFRDTISNMRNIFDNTLEMYSKTPFTPLFVNKEVVPIIKQSLEIIDQFPDLLQVIANGKTEFEPNPIETKEVCRRMYRARRTLLLKFENDALDESEDIEKVLREANTIMRMKRPMIEMQCELKLLIGTHITPLTQNIFLDPPAELATFDIFGGVRTQVKTDFLKTIDDVKREILGWLDNSMTGQ